MDWLLILTTTAFFALCGLYAIVCNRPDNER